MMKDILPSTIGLVVALLLAGYSVGVVIGTDTAKSEIFSSCEKHGTYINENVKMECKIERN